jgi:hydrogenase assembly chaperone HypC/HupF
MCLGMPGQIVEINDKVAVVDFWGAFSVVRLDDLEEPVVNGDFVLSHAGRAVRRIRDEEILDTLAMYETILPETGEDPMACECAVLLET